jgi:hypothetical protein
VVRNVLIREMLFAVDAALAAHTGTAFQQLIKIFAEAYIEFGLTTNLKKSNIMSQDVSTTPTIAIVNHTLEVVDKFTYFGSTISNNLSLNAALTVRIGKTATAMARLAKRVWDNSMQTLNTKVKVYQACVLSTLLYGSEAWTLYMHQEQRLNAWHHLAGSRFQRRCSGQVCQACPPPSLRDACAGSDTYAGWTMAASQRQSLRYKEVCKRNLK